MQRQQVSAQRKEELHTLAKHWELILYHQAHSFEAYVDKSTFTERVQELSRSSNKQDDILMQHHSRLHLLRHAISCKDESCQITPFCSSMRDVWDHVEGCSDFQNCHFPFCYTMKKLMYHSRSCRDEQCQICVPTIHIPGCVLCENERRIGEYGPRESIQTALKQEYLLTMQHASLCPHEEDGECFVSPLCFDLKKVWMHKIYCTKEGCQFPFCKTSRVFADHFNSCRSETCAVCPPVHATRKKFGINKLTVDQVHAESPARHHCVPVQAQAASESPANQLRREAAVAPPSNPDIVPSQVAIYEEIQRRNKERRLPQAKEAMVGVQMECNGGLASRCDSDQSVGHSPRKSRLSPGDISQRHHSDQSASSSQKSKLSALEMQIREYERLNSAHRQRLGTSSSSDQSSTSSPCDDDRKLPARKMEEGPSSPCDDDKKPSTPGVVHNYLATAYSTRRNTKSIVCRNCCANLFVPECATSFFCQECYKVSPGEDDSGEMTGVQVTVDNEMR